jgi:hypothetical protein
LFLDFFIFNFGKSNSASPIWCPVVIKSEVSDGTPAQWTFIFKIIFFCKWRKAHKVNSMQLQQGNIHLCLYTTFIGFYHFPRLFVSQIFISKRATFINSQVLLETYIVSIELEITAG